VGRGGELNLRPEPDCSNSVATGSGWWHYIYAGLRVESQILLPEWAPFERTSTAGDPEVVISLAEAPDSDLTAAGDPGVITAEEYCFFVPGVGGFRVRDGREIVVVPMHGTAHRHLRPWVIGSAWGALCYQRGLFLIHASAVMVDDAAVLFCARAKGGKSTIAARLNMSGHALISDDLCHLDIPSAGLPVVYPSMPRLKLWSDALGELGWSDQTMEPDHVREGKFHIARAGANQTHPVPVQAIYLLEWGEFSLRRLAGLGALRHFLRAATYREKLIASTEQLSKHTDRCLRVLQRVPVWQLRRPRDLATLGQTAELLANHWSGPRIIGE
jgi:hypothetical protein